MLSLRSLGLLTLVLPLAAADVVFVTPIPGSNITGTSLTTTWKESGDAPAISTFSSYSLYLCAGGNNGSDYISLFELQPYATFSSGNQWTGAVSKSWGGNLPNAYFFKMVCTSACGGTVIDYSGKFTISSMIGSFPQEVIDDLAQSGDSTAGPPTDTGGAGEAALSCTASLPGPTSITSATSATIVIAPSTSSATIFPDPPNVAPSSQNNPVTLSSGALAGTIVGAILVFAAVLAIFALIRRHRTQFNNSNGSISPTSALKFWSHRNNNLRRLESNSALSVSELSASAACKEMQADKRQPVESGGSPLTELPARHSVYEMPAS